MNKEPTCEVVALNEILNNNEIILRIPEYQRPYKWNEKNVSELFFDILEAMNKKIERYRIGTIILHEEKDNKIYNIVDGQQRIISLNLLLYAMGQSIKLGLKNNQTEITKYNMYKNLMKFKNLIKSKFEENQKQQKQYIDYLQNKCEFVKIITTSQEDAFKFFDSQNNRGKELELYDILKAYHIREMQNRVSEKEKYEIVEKWEKNESKLPHLFYDCLYQIKQWSRSKDGNTNKWKVDDKNRFFEIFKGIRNSSDERHAKYHSCPNREFRQIDMPIISGQSFFYDIFYYLCLHKDIKQKCLKFKERLKDRIKPRMSVECLVFKDGWPGDKYIHDMMICTLLFIAVKFGQDKINDNILDKIYNWAWYLRSYQKRGVSKKTINNYSLGIESNFIKMFDIINDSVTIRQISELYIPNSLENGDVK